MAKLLARAKFAGEGPLQPVYDVTLRQYGFGPKTSYVVQLVSSLVKDGKREFWPTKPYEGPDEAEAWELYEHNRLVYETTESRELGPKEMP